MKNDQEIKNKIESYGKKLPFSIPDNYFEDFAVRLRERMQSENKPRLLRKTFDIVRPHLALAAAIAAFVIIGYTTAKLFFNNANQPETVEEIADVINYYVYDFDDNVLIMTLLEEESINLEDNPFETNDILDYLSKENNVDYTELIDIY